MTRRPAAQATGLYFYPKSHRYKLDGEWVTGVTTRLKVLDKSRPLIIWSARLVAEYVAHNRAAIEGLYAAGPGPMVAALKAIPEQKRDDAADRGNSLHDFAEQLLRDEDVDVPDELVPVVEQAVRFLDDWRIEPLLIEAPVASRLYKYAGTLDLAATYRNPVTHETGVGIFDWKSGRRIYHEAAFQLAGYGFAEFAIDTEGRNDETPWTGTEFELPKFDASFGVHITAETYDVHPLAFGRDVHEEFVHILRTHEINKRAEGDWRQLGTGYVGIPFAHPDPEEGEAV
jgi:hypothetical protein